MPVECQRMPAVNRFESSPKKVTQDNKIVRKIGKRADDQHLVSAIFIMRLENVEPGHFKIILDLSHVFFALLTTLI